MFKAYLIEFLVLENKGKTNYSCASTPDIGISYGFSTTYLPNSSY
jgi:hypothetical protein